MTGFAIVTALLLRTASPEVAPAEGASAGESVELRDPFAVERPALRAAEVAQVLRDPFAARRPVEGAAPSAGRITDPFSTDNADGARAELVDPFTARAGSGGAPARAQLADPFAARAVQPAPAERADPFEARAEAPAAEVEQRAVVDPWGR